MCKLCDIEHSSSWTCAQAKANFEQWNPTIQQDVPRETSALEGGIPEVPTKLDRSAFMKEWWRQKRANR